METFAETKLGFHYSKAHLPRDYHVPLVPTCTLTPKEAPLAAAGHSVGKTYMVLPHLGWRAREVILITSILVSCNCPLTMIKSESKEDSTQRGKAALSLSEAAELASVACRPRENQE